jgi:hypothetical protein
MHLGIQMLPQHTPKGIHHSPQLRKSQLPLPGSTLRKVRLELIQPVVDLLVLRKELELFPESGHFLREDGEDVLLFDGVVDGEVVRELVARLQEAAQGHALGFFARGAGAVQQVPGLAEVVVLWKGEEISCEGFRTERKCVINCCNDDLRTCPCALPFGCRL